MRPRSTFAWIALALVGMAVAAGASLFASRLTSQDIGLSSEQLTAGKDLAPQQSQAEIDAAATKQRADAQATQDRRRRVAARKRRQRQAAATPGAPPATTTTTTPASPPVRSAPPATTTDDHGGGGDSSGKGRGRGGDDSPDD